MKSKIYATANENLKGNFNISYYIMEKDDSFLDWLFKLLTNVIELSAGEADKAKFIRIAKEDKEGNIIGEDVYKKNVEKMVDLHEKYENKNERIDLFYGKKRVYLTLRCSKKIRKKFADFIAKTKNWIKKEEIKEFQPYLKKITSKVK